MAPPPRPIEVLKRGGKCQKLIIKLKELWEVLSNAGLIHSHSQMKSLQAVGWAASFSSAPAKVLGGEVVLCREPAFHFLS